MKTTIKHNGVVYTPSEIANFMIDILFKNNNLSDLSICDPSCGNGQFLVPLVERLCKENCFNTLQKIYGFDIDKNALNLCKLRLDKITLKYNLPNIKWNLKVIDVLIINKWKSFMNYFDIVIGNPPYIRIQNLEKNRRKIIKQGNWLFKKGANDLYILFYDMGLRLLKPKGNLLYITPKSWLNSHTGRTLRGYLRSNHRINKIYDFDDYQVFSNVSTYPAITSITKNANSLDKIPVEKFIEYKHNKPQFKTGYFILPKDAKWNAQTIEDRTYFNNLSDKTIPLKDLVKINVGIQTLADNVFILIKDSIDIEKEITKPILKASKLQNGKDAEKRVIIYPYTAGNLISEDFLEKKYPKAYKYLLSHKEKLLNRDKGTFPKNKWYAYGRSIAITSGFGSKILTSGINFKPNFQLCLNPNSLFYSGYSIKPNKDLRLNIDEKTFLEKLIIQLNSSTMERYIKNYSKPFRNGWFSYSKSVIENFPIFDGVLYE